MYSFETLLSQLEGRCSDDIDDKPLCHHTSTRANNLRPYIFVYLSNKTYILTAVMCSKLKYTTQRSARPRCKSSHMVDKVDGDVNTW